MKVINNRHIILHERENKEALLNLYKYKLIDGSGVLILCSAIIFSSLDKRNTIEISEHTLIKTSTKKMKMHILRKISKE